jgi:phage terminase large subunit-like protein
LIDCDAAGLDEVFEGFTPREYERLLASWEFEARPAQLPLDVEKQLWRIWLFLGGRGAGKTRAGARLAGGNERTGRAHRACRGKRR